MLPYKTLIQVDRDSSVSLHIQVCNIFISLITEGTLQPSDILPSSRILSDLIGIARNTVKLAYEELISQGWAESAERRGTFVLSKLPVRSKVALFDGSKSRHDAPAFHWKKDFGKILPNENLQQITLAIDDGFPDVRLAPVDLLMREYRSLSRRYQGKNFLKYSSAMGSENLRIALQGYLAHSRGLITGTENILITKGSQMGIFLAAQLLLEPGDQIAVGVSNYGSADDTFRFTGASLLRIPVDEHGMDVDDLENRLKKDKIKAVYIIPHHHFPTTVTMSMERRMKLLNLAKEYQFAIIEDDYDFDFHYDNKPFVPLASIDHNHNVIYIGSISKTFAPALRIGFMVASEDFVKSASTIRQLIDKQGDTLLEEAFAVLFNDGEMDRHFRKSLKVYKHRRNVFCEMIKANLKDSVDFKIPEGGLGVWVNFDKRISLAALSASAAKNGLYIGDGSYYQNESFSPNGLRMGFASLRENEMEQALAIVSKSLSGL